MTARAILRSAWRAPLLSPTGFVVRAAALLVAFGVLHLLGWRDDIGVLTATSAPESTTARTWAGVRALLYVTSYLAAVVIAPILLLAAPLLGALLRLRRA